MFLKNLDGKTMALEPTRILPTTTVRELKDVVEAQEDILPEEHRLSYAGKSFNYTNYYLKCREKIQRQVRQRASELSARLQHFLSNLAKNKVVGKSQHHCLLCNQELCNDFKHNLSEIPFCSYSSPASVKSCSSPKNLLKLAVCVSPSKQAQSFFICSRCVSIIQKQEYNSAVNNSCDKSQPIIELYDQLFSMLVLLNYMADKYLYIMLKTDPSDENRIKSSKQKINELCKDIYVISARIENVGHCSDNKTYNSREVLLQRNIRLFANKAIEDISAKIFEVKILKENTDSDIMFLKNLDGKTIALEPTRILTTTTVRELKDVVEAQEDILPEEQRLSYAGCQLDDDDLLLEEYGLDENATIELNARLLGGGKKRKKKVYTTPKKIKHKRKKIGDHDNIIRNRIECPSATCGGGVFMAKHRDRHYCGRCHNTVTELK